MIKFIQSLSFAWSGLTLLLKHERNFQIQFFSFILVVALGFYFGISPVEWAIILLISALVLSLEAINTGIEKTCDLYSLEKNPHIKTIKDISAGAVLISSLCALCIAILIFKKHLISLLS